MILIPRMPLVLLLLLLILGSAKAQVNPGNTAPTQLDAEDQVPAHTSASGYLRKSSVMSETENHIGPSLLI